MQFQMLQKNFQDNQLVALKSGWYEIRNLREENWRNLCQREEHGVFETLNHHHSQEQQKWRANPLKNDLNESLQLKVRGERWLLSWRINSYIWHRQNTSFNFEWDKNPSKEPLFTNNLRKSKQHAIFPWWMSKDIK